MKLNVQPVKGLRITSKFGPRQTNIKGASTDHKGIDCVGSPVSVRDLILAIPSVLSYKGWNNARGWYCIFKVCDEYEILYQHLKGNSPLTVGKSYPAGTKIGTMGNTGLPGMGIHLHFEVRRNGTPVNPEPYVLNSNLDPVYCRFSEPSFAIKQGYKGEGVSWLQWHLNFFGYPTNVDGSFGPATSNSLAKFQKDNNLVVDKMCGPKTKSAIKAVYNKKKDLK